MFVSFLGYSNNTLADFSTYDLERGNVAIFYLCTKYANMQP